MILLVAPEIPADSDRRRQPIVPSRVFAMVIFIMAEVMFFAGLISAYMIIRSGMEEWPPWGQPRLPVFVTAINSLVLIASAFTLFKAGKQAGADAEATERKAKLLKITLALGGGFLLVQGYEWVKLIGFGLTATSSTYGSLFYLIIGAHGLHVLGGILFLLGSLKPANLENAEHFKSTSLFWYFVVGVWPVIYFLVYVV
jgi:heme/copper-type cytochrome/quinol oxidase subunit 3